MKQTKQEKIEKAQQLLKELSEMRGGSVLPFHKKMANDPAFIQAFVHQYTDTNKLDTSIPRKYRELITLAIGIASRAQTTVEVHSKLALENGATIDEIGEVFRMAFFLCGLTTISPSLEIFEEI